MNSQEIDNVCSLIGLGLIFIVIIVSTAHCCGNSSGIEKMQKEAVVKNFAYYTNDANGESVWKWKEYQINNLTNFINITNITNAVKNLEKE